jgi:hypothetical protein
VLNDSNNDPGVVLTFAMIAFGEGVSRFGNEHGEAVGEGRSMWLDTRCRSFVQASGSEPQKTILNYLEPP